MEFVDRIKEKERLERAISSQPLGLTVVYGKRRIGKSALIIILYPEDIIRLMRQ